MTGDGVMLFLGLVESLEKGYLLLLLRIEVVFARIVATHTLSLSSPFLQTPLTPLHSSIHIGVTV